MAMPTGLSLSEARTKAEDLLGRLAARDFVGAAAAFDARMQEVVPVEALEHAWDQILREAGRFREVAQSEATAEEDALIVVVLRCAFDRGQLIGRLLFDEQGQVAGLHFHAPES